MERNDLDDLALEILDPDNPSVVLAKLADGREFYGSLSVEYFETDEIAGDRSVLLCRKTDAETLVEDQAIELDGEQYLARYIQPRGRVFSAVVLGQ